MQHNLLVSVGIAAAFALSNPAPAFAQSVLDESTQSTFEGTQSKYQTTQFANQGTRFPYEITRSAYESKQSAFERAQSAALKWELSYLALSAIDGLQTIDCLERGICKEANPLFGKNPKPGTIIGAKLIGGALHFALFQRLNKRDPRTALRVAQISAGLQGGVVMLNARFTFK